LSWTGVSASARDRRRGERLTWNLIIGTAMILVGLWIAEHSSAEREVANDTITLSEAEGRRR
jgi:hypothetical protein